MKCSRCHGLLVQESALVGEETLSLIHYLRCLSCGDYVDETILRNRADPLRDMSRQGYTSRSAASIPIMLSGSGC